MLVLAAVFMTLAPTFEDLSAWGGHDWDEMTAQRYLVKKSILEFGQFPLWNPYACGGHSAWANIQGVSALISPWFPFYLLADLRVALRIELVGSTLIGAFGAWLYAGRFTSSHALRLFVCAVFALNGRYAMQAATGHLWHLYYAYTPWTLLFFERALDGTPYRRAWATVLSGTFLALMIYAGGIYPLPHTAVLLGIYAAARAAYSRTLEPLLRVVAIGAVCIVLALPKLLSVVIELLRFPRLVESTEYMDLNAFVQALVARGQTPGVAAARVPQWGWHEYGMYIGWAACFVLLVAMVAARGTLVRSLRWPAGVGVVLAFGAFSEYAPWALLHQLPIFSSQHVPSRWLHPAVLFWAAIAAAGFEGWLAKCREFRAALEFALLAFAAFVLFDISGQSAHVMRTAFWRTFDPPAPAVYYQWQRVPRTLAYRQRDYAPPVVPAMMANTGIIECTLHPSLSAWAPQDARGRVPGQGAVGRGNRRYRGEAYFLQRGPSVARLREWSPNRMVVEYEGAEPGATLILNQNYARGWLANGEAVLNEDDAVAVKVTETRGQVVFTYRPPLFVLSWVLAALGSFGIGYVLFKLRRAEKALPAPVAPAPANVTE